MEKQARKIGLRTRRINRTKTVIARVGGYSSAVSWRDCLRCAPARFVNGREGKQGEIERLVLDAVSARPRHLKRRLLFGLGPLTLFFTSAHLGDLCDFAVNLLTGAHGRVEEMQIGKHGKS